METSDQLPVELQVELAQIAIEEGDPLVGGPVDGLASFGRGEPGADDHFLDQRIGIGARQVAAHHSRIRRREGDRSEGRIKGGVTERAHLGEHRLPA